MAHQMEVFAKVNQWQSVLSEYTGHTLRLPDLGFT